MRLNSARVVPAVSVAADSIRPIRLRVGGSLVLAMNPREAVELAQALADAAEEVRRG